MTIENVKLHTSYTVADAQAIMKILERAEVQFKVVSATDDKAITDYLGRSDFKPVDLYINGDDLGRADMVLRPLFVG
ncbi:MAG: hypothetical protein A2074_03970 [Candidatus Aquicultor primus]|uniref:DUF2007 domain-containing protein n=1 Tax=Candidatus Aquicultor primus TaxID=1797195 RepID=A0A1F2UGA7_9ACTN|nr:MAG: hypothetical protein A2074_03970 [Candidatus Aquicultor primus]HCG99928.1 hypothetical protein [Actinomycetota bacterium]